MKKIAQLLLMCFVSFSYAQEKTATDTVTKKKSDDSTRLFIGFISNINDDLNLNQKLRNADLPDMHNYLPGIGFGFNHLGQKAAVEYMMGFLYNSNSENGYKLLYSGFDVRLSVHYNLMNKDKFALTGGLTTAYTFNYYYLYKEYYTIDLNNPKPENSAGQVNFSNGMFYVGPSVSAYLFKNKAINVKVNAGYEFALTRGKYHNYYGGNIINNTTESGNNRFTFGLLVM